MNARSTKEYDAFGPWIFEIDDEYTMPPLFVKYYAEKEPPLMLIKIPRKIDRKDATPDMHLYDYVIGAFDSHLYIMKRVHDSVEVRRVSYGSVVAIKNTAALLKGQVILYLDDGVMTIDYNTVAENTMMKLINIIREKYKAEEKTLHIESIAYDLGTIDHRYSTVIDQYKAWDDRVRLVAYQPMSKLIPTYKRFYQKAFSIVTRKKVLASTAFITNDTELIVLEREKRIRSGRQGDLSCTSLFLPYKSITQISTTDEAEKSMLKTLSISIKEKVFSFLYGENSLQVNELYSALKGYANGAF